MSSQSSDRKIKKGGDHTQSRSSVSLYTDGSCNGNPGPGGYAAILMKGRWKKEIVGSIPHSTNNRMELHAVISGLSEVKPGSHVTVFSDSLYVVDAVNSGRLMAWQSNGWRRIRTMEPVKNADLWRYYLSIQNKRNLNIKFRKITAHKGHKMNERVDFLARQAAKSV